AGDRPPTSDRHDGRLRRRRNGRADAFYRRASLDDGDVRRRRVRLRSLVLRIIRGRLSAYRLREHRKRAERDERGFHGGGRSNGEHKTALRSSNQQAGMAGTAEYNTLMYLTDLG